MFSLYVLTGRGASHYSLQMLLIHELKFAWLGHTLQQAHQTVP